MERQSRNTTTGGVSNRTFEDYDPAVEWSHAADADTATISLPGYFKKDEVRVLVVVDSKSHLLVGGERPPVEAGSSKWIRFSKDLKLPDNCETEGIHVAKFENSKLTTTIPKKNHRSLPPGSYYALAPPPAAQEEEGKGRPSPSGGSAPPEPAPAVQEEEKKSQPSPPDDGSASEPAPAEQEKSRPSPPDGSAPKPTPPPPLIQEEKNSLPSPPDGCASEPAVAVQEEDEDEEGTTMVEIEMAGGRRPIHWLLVAVAALSFVGITGYVVWRKLRSGCSAAGAGDHGPGELAGAGTFIDEM